ncbi:MAG: aromatic-ring-hydroxylating dioxygenase subunit beta [Pseudomonadota bacterium]
MSSVLHAVIPTGDAAATEAELAAVARLMVRYAHAIDEDRLEEWPEFFTERGFYQIISREDHRLGRPIGVMFCDNRDMLKDRVGAIREANVFQPHGYRHLLGPTEVTGRSGGALVAQTNFMVVRTWQDGTQELFAAGRFLDEIVFDGGEARLRRRVAACDSARVVTMLVLPL